MTALLMVMGLLAGPALAHHTGPLVPAQAFPGNFVASDGDQVCYELDRLGLIDASTDMNGIKVDIPGTNTDPNVTVTISPDGKSLAWQANNGATVHAVIVKGGPNYNLYNYTGLSSSPDHDNRLVSPLHNRKTPAISHYNICYTPGGNGDAEGCTPGYWRNHADRWEGVAPSADWDATFGVDLFAPDITLGQAIWLGGGGVDALARHATAALLNAHGGTPNSGDGATVDYAYSAAQVIEMVQAAADPDDVDNTIESVKDLFDAANNAGCPLSGTRANPVS